MFETWSLCEIIIIRLFKWTPFMHMVYMNINNNITRKKRPGPKTDESG